MSTLVTNGKELYILEYTRGQPYFTITDSNDRSRTEQRPLIVIGAEPSDTNLHVVKSWLAYMNGKDNLEEEGDWYIYQKEI